MPDRAAVAPKRALKKKRHQTTTRKQRKTEPRYSVGLPTTLANQVQRYAAKVDTSVSKAIASLVRLGLESQEARKNEFFKRLKANLAIEDPEEQDRMVDEFRALILGRRRMPKIQ